ncbi:MAG: hypothetical protein VX588_08210 [Verrucomicrobiota bacterium]|nr:hypothetical protein [Verrucomicrobiota bacterium]
MKILQLILPIYSLAILAISPLSAEEVFEFNVGDNGEASQSFSILPEVFLNLTGSLLDSDTPVSGYATSEHDPQKDYQIHPVELHIDGNIGENISGLFYGVALQNEDDEWETGIEEVIIRYDFSDSLSIAGGQFLNRFGFQNQNHLHMWDYVNQNLQNSRLLSEGELITRGIQLDYKPNSRWSINIASGKARLHDHEHGHGDHDDHHDHEGEDHDDHEGEDHDDHEGEDHDDHEGEDHDDHEGEDHEEHHIEADGINISDWITSADVRYYLDEDQTLMVSGSLAVGENEFGTKTWAYGAGVQKLWGGHDHGNGLEFCEGATKLKAEIIGRSAEVKHEDGDSDDVSDWGFSAALFYGLDEITTISARQEYISDLAELELEERHRTSFALSRYLSDNILARIQYDYNRADSIEDEHALWLQFQIGIGGSGSHAGHNH